MSTSTLVYAMTAVLLMGLPQMIPEQSISDVLCMAPAYHEPLGNDVVTATEGGAGSTVSTAATMSVETAAAVIERILGRACERCMAVPPRVLTPRCICNRSDTHGAARGERAHSVGQRRHVNRVNFPSRGLNLPTSLLEPH